TCYMNIGGLSKGARAALVIGDDQRDIIGSLGRIGMDGMGHDRILASTISKVPSPPHEGGTPTRRRKVRKHHRVRITSFYGVCHKIHLGLRYPNHIGHCYNAATSILVFK